LFLLVNINYFEYYLSIKYKISVIFQLNLIKKLDFWLLMIDYPKSFNFDIDSVIGIV